MPDFAQPFSGKVPDRKLNERELVRALRLDIAAEQEAVHLYTAHADATSNAHAREVLEGIANEEIVHVGELDKLIRELNPEESSLLSKGSEETVKAGQKEPWKLLTEKLYEAPGSTLTESYRQLLKGGFRVPLNRFKDYWSRLKD